MRRLFLALLTTFLFSTAASAAEIIVSAAASLTNAFTDIGKQFEQSNPGNKITFNFASSDVLLSQISKGAPADIFASADMESMDRAEALGALIPGTRRVLLTNSLVLIVPADSKGSLSGLAGLDNASVRRIAIGNPASVPAGRYAREALEKAQLWSKLEPKFILAQNVRQALDYVARGEVDAGLVYSTDAAIMQDKVRVVATIATSTPIVYPIALVKDTRNRSLADMFLNYVASEPSRAVFQRYGFGKP